MDKIEKARRDLAEAYPMSVQEAEQRIAQDVKAMADGARKMSDAVETLGVEWKRLWWVGEEWSNEPPNIAPPGAATKQYPDAQGLEVTVTHDDTVVWERKGPIDEMQAFSDLARAILEGTQIGRCGNCT